ncbi:MAG: HAD-IC family P-type ATPase, partial [Bryobacteraceae bacterium]
DPSMLERIESCSTVIMDKTGTLTYGRPILIDVDCAPNMQEGDAVRIAAALERYSKHPLAAPILDRAKRDHIELPAVAEIGERPGQGLSGKIDGIFVQILGRKQTADRPEIAALLPAPQPGLECILVVDSQYAATFRFRDAPRAESKAFVRHLGPKHSVKRVMLLSGDREVEARYLAEEVGITEVFFGKSPEEKVEIVRAESARGSTLFLGDGINDAPAMQAATVGIAFGQHSDVTAEAADAVVLQPSLGKVDELIHIGRRMRRIALQSAIGGMGLSMAGMALAAAGHLTPVQGAIAQEVIDIAAILNALRMAFPSPELRADDREA